VLIFDIDGVIFGTSILPRMMLSPTWFEYEKVRKSAVNARATHFVDIRTNCDHSEPSYRLVAVERGVALVNS
jgi:hypothetical protein